MAYTQYYPITLRDANTIVVSQLRTTLKSLPESRKEMAQVVINFQPYTIPDLIGQIERGTPVGETYVRNVIKGMIEPATGLPYFIVG